MSWFLPAAMLVSTGLQAFGQYQQGQQQQTAYNYNATEIERAGAIDIYKLGKEQAEMAGAQRAAYARGNVLNKGSALDVQLNTASTYEFDKIVANYNTTQQAAMQRYYGKTAVINARYKMGETLLSGAVKTSDYLKIPTKSSYDFGPSSASLAG